MKDYIILYLLTMFGHPIADRPILTNSARSYLHRPDFLMNISRYGKLEVGRQSGAREVALAPRDTELDTLDYRLYQGCVYISFGRPRRKRLQAGLA